MKPLDQRRLIDAHKLNHTAKVIKKFVPQGSILEQLMNLADSIPDFRRGDKGNFRHRLRDIIILMILLQDKVKRKSAKAARNLDTIQKIVCTIFSAWKGRRRKKADKKKGFAELMRHISKSFTLLIRFLAQKWKKLILRKR